MPTVQKFDKPFNLSRNFCSHYSTTMKPNRPTDFHSVLGTSKNKKLYKVGKFNVNKHM